MNRKSKLLFVLGVIAILSLCSCNSQTRQRVSRENNSTSAKFEDEMKKGRTTREQEQKYISATSVMFLEMDRSIRGTKRAEETRRQALSIINSNQPIDPSQ